ncbi:MAG: GNVR domain-containing protein [Burkholderiaceae bacterium]
MEEAYKQLQGRRADRYLAPAVVNHPAVTAAKTVEAMAERRFAEIKQKYGPAFPTYKEAEKQFDLAKADTKRQADAVISSIEKEYRAALASERAMEESLKRVQGSVQATNRKEIDLSNFEREVATNRHLYETFLARVKETNAAGDIQSAAARIVDPAQPGRQPVKPKKVQISALALLGSLLGASMLAFLLNRLDNTVKTTEAVENRLGEPLLGALPKLSPAEAKSASRLVKDAPSSGFAEAVRTVSTAILLGTLDHPHKVVAVTSALPGEGSPRWLSTLRWRRGPESACCWSTRTYGGQC